MFPRSPRPPDMLFSGATNTSQNKIEFLGFFLSVLQKEAEALSWLMAALLPHPSAASNLLIN